VSRPSLAASDPSRFGGHAQGPARSSGLLVLLRHGESQWNREKRFTGWADVDLSPEGEAQAVRTGDRLQRAGYQFDFCFTSVLRRATRTAEIVLAAMRLEGRTLVEQSWRLNERHYGALQGLGMWRAVRRYGLLPVLRCQREWTSPPPALEPGDPRFPGHDSRYASLLPEEIPRAESLRDTLVRLQPYWEARIAPQLASGRRILVVSHKNALRALMKLVERLDDSEVKRVRVPTGTPIVLVFDPSLTIVDRPVLPSTHGLTATAVSR
jgi:2,3-bisphosphoglycerate-dependent phosphoglycerate mutase